jgi:hypothetical protein
LPTPEIPLVSICSTFSRSSSSQPRLRAKKRQNKPSHQRLSPHTASEANEPVCICGTPLSPSPGRNRIKRYCSDRCSSRARMRAKRQREKQGISCSSQPLGQSPEEEVLLTRLRRVSKQRWPPIPFILYH